MLAGMFSKKPARAAAVSAPATASSTRSSCLEAEAAPIGADGALASLLDSMVAGEPRRVAAARKAYVQALAASTEPPCMRTVRGFGPELLPPLCRYVAVSAADAGEGVRFAQSHVVPALALLPGGRGRRLAVSFLPPERLAGVEWEAAPLISSAVAWDIVHQMETFAFMSDSRRCAGGIAVVVSKTFDDFDYHSRVHKLNEALLKTCGMLVVHVVVSGADVAVNADLLHVPSYVVHSQHALVLLGKHSYGSMPHRYSNGSAKRGGSHSDPAVSKAFSREAVLALEDGDALCLWSDGGDSRFFFENTIRSLVWIAPPEAHSTHSATC